MGPRRKSAFVLTLSERARRAIGAFDGFARQQEWCDGPPGHPAVDTIVGIARELDELTLDQSARDDVIRMHQHDVASPLDPPEAIRIAVDRGVELIVRPHRCPCCQFEAWTYSQSSFRRKSACRCRWG